MQLVPLVPQQKIGVEKRPEVTGITAVKAAKSVADKTLPPLLSHIPPDARNVISQREKRQYAPLKERRLVCRRFQHLPILEELRSTIDRRRHNLRSTDFQLHIDEEV